MHNQTISDDGFESQKKIRGLRTEQYCRCCKTSQRRAWLQPPLIHGRPHTIYTDCLNPECDHYYLTLEHTEYLRRTRS